MRIISTSFNHHKVFGDTKINFFQDSETEREKLVEKHHSDLVLEIDKTSQENYYTFIIGDNGAGKSVLMRNIVDYMNWNSHMDEPKLDSIINLYSENSNYQRFKNTSADANDLLSFDIYNKYFVVPGTDEFDFLKYHQAQTVFINGAYEKPIVHSNPRFRSFNYTSQINDTKILFLNSLIRFKDDSKLEALDRLLGHENINWILRCGLAIEGRTVKNKEDERYLYILNQTDGINIFNFLDLIKKIEIDENDKLITENLTRREQNIFESIYYSPLFFTLFFISDMSFKTLFDHIRSNHIISRIEEFVFRDLDIVNQKSLNASITEDQKQNWDFLITETSTLTGFDSYLLSLLLSLNLLNITITGDELSIDRMSSGQKNLIRLFSYFAHMPLPKQLENCIVFFDEPENSLHPKWQQEFPLNFKRIVEDVYGITSSHFIFATHSPILLMKSALLKNSNVLRFYRDANNIFQSELVKNVSAYSIEEVLLDEFKISYRDQSVEDTMRKILDAEFQNRSNQQDPIDSIKNAFDLRDRINDLFNELNEE